MFLDLVKKRQSDRLYHSTAVEPEKILRCIEAARLAPSACNSQPWHFIVVDNPELKKQLADATSDKLLSMNHFTYQAPVHVVLVREKANITARLGGLVKDRDFTVTDCGIAAAHFCLQAADEGLGTCMLGWFKEKRVKELLQIPSSKRVELIITLGYPANATRNKVRKTQEQILSFNKY